MEKLAYEFSTIVTVAPLVAIMKHQVEQLKRFGITETAIYRLYIDWGRGGGGRGEEEGMDEDMAKCGRSETIY